MAPARQMAVVVLPTPPLAAVTAIVVCPLRALGSLGVLINGSVIGRVLDSKVILGLFLFDSSMMILRATTYGSQLP